MGTDLHSPLGANRKAKPSGRPPFGMGKLLLAVAVVGVAGLSLWAANSPSNLKQKQPEIEVATGDAGAKADPAGVQTDDDADKTANQVDRSKPLTAANVEKTTLDDGSVVTKFTPLKRDTDGPVIIDAKANNGQDRRVASLPNDDLLEDSPFGRLPIIGPDGERSVDQYARPWSGARGTRIAIVVGGLGLSQTGTQRAIKQLPEEITLAFAATGNSLQRWMQEARRNGHEILLQLPMEPFDYPSNNPGAMTLLSKSAPEKNLERLHEALGRITNYTGVMNYLGGRFMADADAAEPVMRDLAGRGLLFLDDGSSAQSLSGTMSKVFSMPHAFADVELDGQLNRAAIFAKLDELERVAMRKGTAIGVGSGFDETIDAVREWSEEAPRRGIEIVGVSALASIPN